MKLEEMETLWRQMSSEIEKQKKLTDSVIIKMTKAAYRNKMGKILIPETIGAVTCVLGAAFVIAGFQKLNTWCLLACGVISVLILFILPILSIKAIGNIRSVNISKNNYKESLLEYSKGQMQWVFVQKLTFYLGAVLMLVILPVMGKLIGGTDFFKATRLWYWYALGFPFFYYFASWVFKSYRKTAPDAENILKELDIN